MAKVRSSFVCQQCGYSQIGWAGKCPQCGAWGSLVETITQQPSSSKKTGASTTAAGKAVALSDIPLSKTKRIVTDITELDRVLGGGLVPGQIVLLAGEPGIGKSTILLQVAEKVPAKRVLYASGEESIYQIKLRAERLKIKTDTISVMEETNIDALVSRVKDDANAGSLPGLIIVDSIQTMSTSDLSSMAGSVGQVRESTFRLVQVAKNYNIPVFVVGHVTKEGTVAGPSVLMHMVDTVLWFEGDKNLSIRLLRAVKNRFGSTDEVGIFSMEERGLISMDSPEKLFITDTTKPVPGNAVVSVLQGTRPVLVEVQALVVPTKMAFPRRVAQGFDAKRFELLLAVLTRRCGIPVLDYDCYLNVTGGITVSRDPSADLGICLAVASAYRDVALPLKSIAIGEIGLLGDIRSVTAQEKRIKEAKRLGYKTIINNKTAESLREVIGKYLK